MFGQDPHAVYEMIERLHGSLCCYRELRAKYRGRAHRAAPPATASASPAVGPSPVPASTAPQPPPAATVSPPTVGRPAAPPSRDTSPPPAATVTQPEVTRGTPMAPPPSVPGVPGLADSLILGYRTVQGRMVPVYADPGEQIGPAANGDTSAPNKDALAPLTAPPAAQTAPSPSTDSSPPTVHASPPRTQHTATTLSLDPPTPPPIVREVDQTASIERILAEHRALLAEQARAADERHAAIVRELLTEHRQALATADERYRELLADLLARHRDEMEEASARDDGGVRATADLRELLAEQTTAFAEQNACLGDMIATLVETVSRIALSRATPRAPIFTPPPPLRVVAAADEPKATTDPGAPYRDATTPPRAPTPAPTTSSAADPSTSPVRVAAESASAPTTRPTPPPPSPSATTPAAQSSPATQTTRVGNTPGTSSLLAHVTELFPAAAPDRPTPREFRAQQEARDRQRMYEAVDECADDDDFMGGADDDAEAVEASRA